MYLLPIVAGVMIVPAITVAMYFQFNAPGADYAMGMTGRYLHLPYYMVLASLLLWTRDLLRGTCAAAARRPVIARCLQIVCAVLCVFAAYDAVHAIWQRFYAPL
jgi:hypothetical protein